MLTGNAASQRSLDSVSNKHSGMKLDVKAPAPTRWTRFQGGKTTGFVRLALRITGSGLGWCDRCPPKITLPSGSRVGGTDNTCEKIEVRSRLPNA